MIDLAEGILSKVKDVAKVWLWYGPLPKDRGKKKKPTPKNPKNPLKETWLYMYVTTSLMTL